VQAAILHRAGYDTFNWGDKAILRAFQWLYNEANFPAVGDDTWELPLVDYYYGTEFWDGSATRCGKNMGWTDWTHAKGREVVTEAPMPPLGRDSGILAPGHTARALRKSGVLGKVRIKAL